MFNEAAESMNLKKKTVKTILLLSILFMMVCLNCF